MINRKHHIAGYTLIELSITVTILSLIVTGGLTFLQKKQESDRIRITTERIALIEEALKAFANEQAEYYVPCPADPLLLESNASFGLSSTYNSPFCATVVGAVPTRTLHIPDELAYDGWERKFTYSIGNNMGSNADFSVDDNYGDISIQNLVGNEKTQISSIPSRGAAYVIVSHGPNVRGAYAKNATTAPLYPDASSQEYRNTDDDPANDKIFIQDELTTDFDDIVAFGTKSDLILLRFPIVNPYIPLDICTNADLIKTEGDAGLAAYRAAAAPANAYDSHSDTIVEAAEKLTTLCESQQK